jgi:hypothetical protein
MYYNENIQEYFFLVVSSEGILKGYRRKSWELQQSSCGVPSEFLRNEKVIDRYLIGNLLGPV